MQVVVVVVVVAALYMTDKIHLLYIHASHFDTNKFRLYLNNKSAFIKYHDHLDTLKTKMIGKTHCCFWNSLKLS